ncbi:hypothetical protein LIER_26356 [Lithospermum erythrorhizon]|uniref:KHG/KDPG aldolase n=1 Tax=Lithospermum erythrorhizon TaxID=34254 RepID=A0AAV3RBF8_LITER
MALEAARAALSGGITVLEIVVSTPGVYEVLRQLELDYPTAILGVGTILDSRDAKDAIKCGVKFLMSPAIVMDIFEDVSDNQALYIPGVMTPTEILSVYNAGAKIVKVYPVSALGGVQYVAALSKPFSHIPMVASQGIKTDMIGEYIGQGASAVVLSDAIFDMAAMRDRDFTAIHHLACHASLLGSEAVKRSLDDGRQISR